MPRPFQIFSQSDYLIQIVDINSHTEWQTVQIQISWLLRSQLIWIYTVCKGQVYPGSAGQGLIIQTCLFSELDNGLIPPPLLSPNNNSYQKSPTPSLDNKNLSSSPHSPTSVHPEDEVLDNKEQEKRGNFYVVYTKIKKN